MKIWISEEMFGELQIAVKECNMGKKTTGYRFTQEGFVTECVESILAQRRLDRMKGRMSVHSI